MEANSIKMFEKILEMFVAKSSVGGLEISDSALRYARLENNEWRLITQKLPAGTVNNGEIKNPEDLLFSLVEMRKAAVRKSQWEEKASVIVSLSSRRIYTQVFSLPVMPGENIENAINLNMKMISPLPFSELYMSWQVIDEGKDKLKMEVSAGFMKKTVADAIISMLGEAGFKVAALESKALALARVFRLLGSGFISEKPYLLIDVDDEGLEFLIVRSGELHFEYFEPWADVYAAGREIKVDELKSVMVRSLNQVINFYRQRWPDPISEIVLNAAGLREEIEGAIREHFPYEVKPFGLKIEGSLSSEWYAALGSGLRGLIPRRKDKEISLLGVSALEEYHREQLSAFLRFWRLVVPIVCAIVLASLILTDIFVIKIRRDLESSTGFNVADSSLKMELAREKEDVLRFNRSLEAIKKVRGDTFDFRGFLQTLLELSSKNGISLDLLSLEEAGGASSLSGHAVRRDSILAYKKSLELNGFEAIDIPLSSIKSDSQGFSFSLSFRLAAPKAS